VHADLVDMKRAIAAVSLTPPPRSILHAFVFSTCANVMGITWLAAVWWRRHSWAMRRHLNSRGELIAGMRVAFVSLVSEAVCAMCAVCCLRVCMCVCECGYVYVLVLGYELVICICIQDNINIVHNQFGSANQRYCALPHHSGLRGLG